MRLCRLTLSNSRRKRLDLGAKRLTLKHDELASSVAFNFNLRRYNGVLHPVRGRGPEQEKNEKEGGKNGTQRGGILPQMDGCII